jgi:membrane protein implicated in regulation of membrane protease activity
MMFIGADADGGAEDVDVDVSDGDISEGIFGDNEVSETVDAAGFDGFKIFTVRGIIAFLVVFGWVGVLMDNSGVHLAITIPVAVVCGFVMMVALAFLFNLAMKLRNDGNTDNRNAIGVSGKVHLTIPPARSGEGKVHLMLQGAYIERDAVTDDGEAIPTGSEIIVVGISGQTTLVVKRK